MGIDLFEHNAKAYDAAVSMLSETGKAAIVHPTGTGKSFIGFKLAEDNLDSVICWLSPSEYIFKTQLENLAATGATIPENISFFTYAKLMNMSDDEISEINPAFIILDEFHRCGAELWGKGVQSLLAAYQYVPVLGLSATNIRYLDNQRDMADELFDGNVASEMTLGEAIVRGILAPPKYVISVYSYQKELQKYRRSINSVHLRGFRKTNEQYLDDLRRALEQADGLDVVFGKHITDKSGKYIVFCTSKEHMDEMVDKADEWFSKIDKKPHIYTAYSDDPETSKAFASFKADSSEHLKLLYCIDMLNEGIHVDDISGVILLRPTVSPTLYKQQIGRALSTGKTHEPLIIDVVNNFENLMSTDAIEKEMEFTVSYLRARGEGNKVINEHFTIYDETKDCRELFDRLQKSISVPWDAYFEAAKAYSGQFGNLEVPWAYKTEDGLSLGSWIEIQRKIKAGILDRVLTDEQITRLESIGMIWKSRLDIAWDKWIDIAQEYKNTHGDLDVPRAYITPDGKKLGDWIIRVRQWRASHVRNSMFTPERIAQLDSMGMIWNKISLFWEQSYTAAVKYYVEHGNIDIPQKYIAEDGTRLGDWIFKQRKARMIRGVLSDEQISRLDAIGMEWYTRVERYWRKMYEVAKQFYADNGLLDVPPRYVTSDKLPLGMWIKNQRSPKKTADKALVAEHIELLDRIGMIWDKPRNPWERQYEDAKRFYEKNEHLRVSIKDDHALFLWLYKQRKAYDDNALTDEQIMRLEDIGMVWLSHNEIRWEQSFVSAEEYYREFGNLRPKETYVSPDGIQLGVWLKTQRKYEAQLSPEQKARLNSIGMVWGNIKQLQWMEHYTEAEAFYKANGHLDVPESYIESNGGKLRKWIYLQKRNRAAGNAQPNDEQIALLDDIGMDWSMVDRWAERYEDAKQYYETHGDLSVPTKYINEDGIKLGSWVSEQRKMYKRGILSADRIRLLNEIGMEWVKQNLSVKEDAYITHCER